MIRMYFWWSVGTWYSLHACQVRVTVAGSGLCCYTCVTYFEHWLTPLCVDKNITKNLNWIKTKHKTSAREPSPQEEKERKRKKKKKKKRRKKERKKEEEKKKRSNNNDTAMTTRGQELCERESRGGRPGPAPRPSYRVLAVFVDVKQLKLQLEQCQASSAELVLTTPYTPLIDITKLFNKKKTKKKKKIF